MVNFGSSVSPLKQLHKSCSEDRKSLKKKAQPVDPMAELVWNIWPADDVIKVTEIIEECPELMERRQGLKQETILHRYVGPIKKTGLETFGQSYTALYDHNLPL